MKKRRSKIVTCLALSSAMAFTNVGTTLPVSLVKIASAEEVAKTIQKTFTADQLEADSKWSSAVHALEDGKWNLKFEKQYDQIKLKLPESIDLSKIKAIKFKVADQSGTISLKVYNAGEEIEGDTKYELSGYTEYTMNPAADEGAIDYVGIMTTDTKDFGSVKLESVTFELEESSSAIEYTADKLTKVHDEGAEGSSCELKDDKWSIQLKHDKDYGYPQAVWTLPESIDLSKVKAVKFNVKNQTAAVALKLGMDDGNGWYDDVEVAYGQDNADTYVINPKTKTGKFDRVVVMTTESDASLDLVSVVVELDANNVKPEIEKDIPDWKDSILAEEALGSDGIAGGEIMLSEITDDALMELVGKHFNAVTFGNELKPDALFNYQLENSVPTTKINFNGEDLEVPVVKEVSGSAINMDFSRADQMVDKIMAWNEAHPDKKIRIRGHVLVWHSQTPEWFFHENYDINKSYVDKETMNRRLEWFISSVLDHYFGEAANHKYDGLFYGWDVVNEAVIGNSYRTDKVSASEALSEITHGNNSSWWHIYESNEFIINAFKYANKYAPKDVELYYNDFGETDNTKCEGIIKLINDVKAAEGTRLDAFGMQAHYSVDGFSAAQFKTVAEKYAKAAGKVQLTELDFKASEGYDGSAAAKESEYTKMAYCHKNLFEAIKALNKSGSKVSGLTVWGIIEPNSWLHEQSNVGGGANGSKQCPLLFDGDYKAKPAFYAYVDASKLQPAIQKITINESKNGEIEGEIYNIEQDEVQASFIPVWSKDGLTVQVNVKDSKVDTNDFVTVYVDPSNSASELTPVKVTVKGVESVKTEDGYKATVKVPMSELKVGQKISMDVAVTNDGKIGNFNDLTGKQETTSKYYAVASIKPGVEKIPYGTITVDAEEDSTWNKAVTIPLTINKDSEVSANAKILWDNDNLYVYAKVKDAVLDKTGGQAHEQDSLEVFIDEDNGKTVSYGEDDKQYRINYDNEQSFNGKKCNAENVSSKTKLTDDGYVVEAAFKWTDIKPEKGTKIGLELQINDAKEGKRIGTLSWYDETGMGWSGSNVYGTVELTDKLESNAEKPISNPITGIIIYPSSESSVQPTATPTVQPTLVPTIQPTATPEATPTVQPALVPTAQPTVQPSGDNDDYDKGGTSSDVADKGLVVKKGAAKYVVTKASGKNKTVAFNQLSNKSAKKVTIPNQIKIDGKVYKVTAIEKNAFKDAKKLKEVVLGSNIQSIGDAAFINCKKLQSVKISKKVTKIGKNVFKGCANLKTLVVNSDKITSVGKNAFKGVKTNVTVKTSKKSLKKYSKMFVSKGKMPKKASFVATVK